MSLSSDDSTPSPVRMRRELPSSSDQLRAAEQLVNKLTRAGFETYLTGGWVRDLVLGRACQDIDIATGANLSQIAKLLPKTIPVGARFGCLIAIWNSWQFEVTSFRKEGGYLDGRHPSVVEPGTAREDAWRRDFTLNGLFYDLDKRCVLDFVGGLSDIRERCLRCIGIPSKRFAEDKLRILRCARLAAELQFAVDERTKEAARDLAGQVSACVSKERIWQELEKLAAGRHSAQGFSLLFELHLGDLLIPFADAGNSQTALALLARVPRQAPLIYSLLALWFPRAWISESRALFPARAPIEDRAAQAFLLSRLDRRRVHLWLQFAELFARDFPPSLRADWCNLMADPLAEECFANCRALCEQSAAFALASFADQLAPHVQRRLQRRPLVTSSHLRALGIGPGRKLGELLRSAESIAVQEDLHRPEQVLERLPLPDRRG